MQIDQNGRLKVSTAHSVYHLGKADDDGSRTITRDGRELGFERVVLLGSCNSSQALDLEEGGRLEPGRRMALMPLPEEGLMTTSPVISIEQELQA